MEVIHMRPGERFFNSYMREGARRYVVVAGHVVVAVEGDAHDGQGEEVTRSDVPDLNGGVHDGMTGELEEYHTHSDEDRHDREDTDVTEGIHG